MYYYKAENIDISYPIMQGEDNEYYLKHTFEGQAVTAASIFMDANNHADFSDQNTFIYGHNMKDKTMFGKLNNYKDEEFYKENPYFYIYTPDGKVRMYKVFAASVVKDTSDAYNLTYNSDEEFESYLNLCRESSNYQVDVEVNAQSQIVSLSTCTNVKEDERFLLQGVLAGEY